MAKTKKWLPWLIAGAVAGVFFWKKKSGLRIFNRFNSNAHALNPNLSSNKITEAPQVVQNGGMSLDDPNLTAAKAQQIKDYK